MSSIKFGNIPFDRKLGNSMGVYKMIFDNANFYIGGSVKLRSRLSEWKFRIRDGKPKNKNITEVLKNCKQITFEILEFVTDKSEVKIREDFHLKSNWGNEFLLNRCPSAFDNKGIELRPEEIENLNIIRNKAPRHVFTIEEIQERRKFAIDRGLGQKVGKFSIDDVLIEIYPSISEAARSNNTTSKTLAHFFKGNGNKVKGFIFKKIDANGEVINIVKKFDRRFLKRGALSFEKKELLRKNMQIQFKLNPERYTRGNQPKKVEVINAEGKLVKVYQSITQASKDLKIGTGNICKVLDGSRSHALGFKFKYAI